MIKQKIKFHIILLAILGLFLISANSFQENLPSQAYISGVVGHAQSYGLSCESQSAADLANFWGVPVTETEFFLALPKSDDPSKGFVGDVNGPWGYIPPKAYGVHANPVAQTLEKYGFTALAQHGMVFSDLKAEIAAGRPVIVWVIGGVWSGTAQNYTAQDGNQTIVAQYEHTMLMIGYDTNYVYLIDAGSGLNQTHTINNFQNSWAVLGNMAVTAKLPEQDKPSPVFSEGTYTVKSGDYLSQLAEQFGMTWQDLAVINNISYPYIIFPGQVLKTSQEVKTSTPSPTATSIPTSIPPASPVPNSVPTEIPTVIPTSTPVPAPTQNVAAPTDNSYTVLSGEHLMQIARKLQLNWQAMAELNGLTSPFTLHPGQVLILPGPEAGPPPPPLDSDSPIVNTPTTSTNNNESLSGKTYTVQNGEYIVSIARKLEINWTTLAAINNLTYPYLVYPGQVINLP